MSINTKRYGSVVQKTLKRHIACFGIGLHSGRRVFLTLRPGEVNQGVTFIRTDIPGTQGIIAAHWDRVIDTRLCTVIGNEHGISVGTIEHLMAALRGCGVDNAVIEIDGPEVPILDGSSAPWVMMIRKAGIVRQAARRRIIKIHEPVSVSDGDKRVSLTPSPMSQFTVEIDFPSAAVGVQKRSLQLANGSFKRDIASARTFGFAHEVDELRRIGLARGGSLENAILIDGDTVLNKGGLRFQDEFVRHKILDSIGDLYLAGAPIIGHFYGRKPGHRLNNELLQALFANPNAWSYVTPDQVEVSQALGAEEGMRLSA